MRTIIAGSRDIWANIDEVIEASGFDVSVVISGTARGIDRLGEQWAEENNIPIMRFPADWKKYGKAAGFLRNREMAEHAEALIAVWDGYSPGTKNMIENAKQLNLSIFTYIVGDWIDD